MVEAARERERERLKRRQQATENLQINFGFGEKLCNFTTQPYSAETSKTLWPQNNLFKLFATKCDSDIFYRWIC